MVSGTKSAQFLLCWLGFMDEFPTTLMVNGWPRSSKVSAPLTGVEAKVPVAVKVTSALTFGLAAAAKPEVKTSIAAVAARGTIFRIFNENTGFSFFESITEV